MGFTPQTKPHQLPACLPACPPSCLDTRRWAAANWEAVRSPVLSVMAHIRSEPVPVGKTTDLPYPSRRIRHGAVRNNVAVPKWRVWKYLGCLPTHAAPFAQVDLHRLAIRPESQAAECQAGSMDVADSPQSQTARQGRAGLKNT